MDNYCKVLIVDDEFITRQGIKHMLAWEKEGFQIVGEAADGKEGLELVESMKPHIVLADIVMPVLDGIEFSKILQQRYPEVQLIILSSYDKFEYVKTTLLNGAVDYVLKPTLNPEILLKTLLKTAKKIPGMILRREQNSSPEMHIERMLSGYQENIDEVLFSKVLPYTQYRILGVNLKTACDGSKTCMMKIRDVLEDFFVNAEEYAMVSFLMEEKILCLLLNYRMKDEEFILNKIQTCTEMIHNMLENVFFVVGKSFHNIKQIEVSYKKEIVSHVDQRFYYPTMYMLMIQDDYVKKEESRFAFEEYSKELMCKQYEEALARFQKYVEQIQNEKVEEYRLKNLTKNLLYNFLIEIEQYEIDIVSLRKTYFLKIEEASDINMFGQVMQYIFMELKQIMEEQIGVEDERIRKIKRYIYDNYADNLELSILAERFGFSYHYLSSYFSSQTKEGFSEYLNKVRIEKAMKLLEEPTLSIAQISCKVGYTDQSYFCRVFKKITGETPSGYRRHQR